MGLVLGCSAVTGILRHCQATCLWVKLTGPHSEQTLPFRIGSRLLLIDREPLPVLALPPGFLPAPTAENRAVVLRHEWAPEAPGRLVIISVPLPGLLPQRCTEGPVQVLFCCTPQCCCSPLPPHSESHRGMVSILRWRGAREEDGQLCPLSGLDPNNNQETNL